MNESILKALMQLFALVSNVDEQGLSPEARSIIEEYLKLHLSQDIVEEYLKLFDYFLGIYHTKSTDDIKVKKRISVKSVKVLTISEEINNQLQQKEKIIVILRLLEFIKISGITPEEIDFIDTIASVFNIKDEEYQDIKNFILHSPNEIINKKNLLLISGLVSLNKELKYIKQPGFNGNIYILYLPLSNIILVKYEGYETVYLNGFIMAVNHCYIFEQGSVLKSSKLNSIYYTDIISRFIHNSRKEKIIFCAENISFIFPKSKNGIKPFSIYEESGRLVGIMGSSGAGKSTLLNLLIGTLPLETGKITINGYDIHKDKEALKGIIGYVPQDDLLIEELSVFQNLYYNAMLVFKDYSKYQIISRVVRILKELDLYEIKNLKVGNPLNKYISGGQRKRLNIALELLREPAILFVDEPTSGLSSSDAEIVISLLKELTLKGKLIFVNIHQPSSDIFKQFDKLIIIDKKGYPVYYGNPIESISYFRRLSNIASPDDVICPNCGNINPEQILELIEAKVVNEYGKLTNKRKFLPEYWYEQFKKNILNKLKKNCKQEEKHQLPQVFFKTQTKFKQFQIFSIRNVLRKFTNVQYIVLNFLESPILGLILAFFSKYISGTAENPDAYIFANNVNIPAFLFMSVVVALFLGLTVSAEEIIKDKKILKREEFLNLSYKAYVNSKIIFLIFLSAIQMFLYVVISHKILGIHGLIFKHWLVLFLTALWANILGLNLSSWLNSVVTIYISIPLVLIPQLLFSGTVINFSKLHKDVINPKYVPVIGDLMTSRWTYEALMIAQFKHNLYQKHFFDVDKEYYNAIYNYSIYYDKLVELAQFLYNNKNNKQKQNLFNKKYNILYNELMKLAKSTGKKCYCLDSLKNLNKKTLDQLNNYLYYNLKLPNQAKQQIARKNRDKIYYQLIEKLGSDSAVIALKINNHNKRVEDYVTNRIFEIKGIKETDNELVRLYFPVYQIPDNRYGRAHFYAGYKRIGNKIIDTFWFNTTVIILYTLIIYLILVFRIFKTNNLMKKLQD